MLSFEALERFLKNASPFNLTAKLLAHLVFWASVIRSNFIAIAILEIAVRPLVSRADRYAPFREEVDLSLVYALRSLVALKFLKECVSNDVDFFHI